MYDYRLRFAYTFKYSSPTSETLIMASLYNKVIFDVIHGNIRLTRVEDRVLKSAYYQRLRWIRQLGFSFYIYPGANHTRFAHALGVMWIMHRALMSIGKGVPNDRLYNNRISDDVTIFHRTMRLAAMLHDIGTFPFSHTTELGYINHWKKRRQAGSKEIMANHENLGAHIILNTDFEGGITRILKEEGINPKELSEIISGKSKVRIANQLLHSDVDVDRMDYLLRDSHHTGIKYGQYDKEFLIRNLTTFEVDGQEVIGINEEALNVVEYFLVSRYSWYSQIIDDGTGYKFDLMAAKISEYFLENDLAPSFETLINKVSQDPDNYFSFNDSYFMAQVHEYLAEKKRHPLIHELCEMLAYRRAPKQIKIAPVQPTLIQSPEHRQAMVVAVTEAAKWLENEIKQMDSNAWMIFDIPAKDIQFTKTKEQIRKEMKGENVLLSRDPVKIVTRNGEPRLLIDVSSSILQVLSSYRNFIPRIYVSDNTYEQLEKKGLLKAMRDRYKENSN